MLQQDGSSPLLGCPHLVRWGRQPMQSSDDLVPFGTPSLTNKADSLNFQQMVHLTLPQIGYTDGSFATDSASSTIITNLVLVLNDPDAFSLTIFGHCLTPDPFTTELSALILALQSTHHESELFLISDCSGALQIL